ncbi:MAG: hypothetical protein D6714_16205 [Bacteroidetes bacterium]|nr:MAG: hypothetical protein D6714_16205 [Bacteroidota bacterium]
MKFNTPPLPAKSRLLILFFGCFALYVQAEQTTEIPAIEGFEIVSFDPGAGDDTPNEIPQKNRDDCAPLFSSLHFLGTFLPERQLRETAFSLTLYIPEWPTPPPELP